MLDQRKEPDSPPGWSPVDRLQGNEPTASYQSGSAAVNEVLDTSLGATGTSPRVPQLWTPAHGFPDGDPSQLVTPAQIQVSTLAHGRHTLDTNGKLVVSRLIPLGDLVQHVRTSEDLRDRTKAMRDALARGGRTGQYEMLKVEMPAIVPAACAPAGIGVKGLSPARFHNGLYGYDIDEGRESMDLVVLRAQLVAAPGAVLVAVSCAGDALYAVFAGPRASNADEYKRHWQAIASQMPPGAAVANSPASKNFNRVRFVPHDPNIWLAEQTQSLSCASVQETPRQGKTKRMASSARIDDGSIDRDALQWILCPRSSDDGGAYNQFVGWLGTLKSLGFNPQEAADWCSTGKATSCGRLEEVESRWDGLPEDNPEGARNKLRGSAYKLGWRDPEIHRRRGVGTPAGPPPGVRNDQEAPDSLDTFVKAGYRNCTDAANLARFLRDHSPVLVIALPDITDPYKTPADIYAVTRTGMLSQTEADALLLATGRSYLADCYDLDPREMAYVASHARSLRNAKAMDPLRSISPASIIELDKAGALAGDLVVRRRSDIDANLRYIGTPQGVLDLITGELVPPADARSLFIVSSIPDDWNPRARHPKVDLILPPIDEIEPESPEEYRAWILGYVYIRAPRREFMWEVCDEGSGKSAFAMCLRLGFGDCYIHTIRKDAIQPTTHASGSTSHNGDIRHFGKPSRICFVMEMAGRIDGELVKHLTGGDEVPYRLIKTKDENLFPTAHLWIMGNTREGADAPALGIASGDANARAIRDRAKILHRDRIADDECDDSIIDMGKDRDDPDHRLFRQAVVARVVEYTGHYAGGGFPAVIPSFSDLLDRQANEETPRWKLDWLPYVLAKAPDDPNDSIHLRSSAHDKDVYTDYLSWYQLLGDGDPETKPVVCKAICKHYNITPKQERVPGTRLRVRYYPGYVLAEAAD